MTGLIKEIIMIVETKWWKIYKVGINIFLSIAFLWVGYMIIFLIIPVMLDRLEFGRREPEIHYIPKDFIGVVVLINNDKSGKDKEYQGKTRIYNIPKSGILRTQFKRNLGSMDSEKDLKFYYKMDSLLVEIPKRFEFRGDENILDSNQVMIFEYGGGVMADFDIPGDVLTYVVDSLKKYKHQHHYFTKEMYDSWYK